MIEILDTDDIEFSILKMEEWTISLFKEYG